MVELTWDHLDYTGEQPSQDAMVHGIELHVVKPAESKKRSMLMPKRWVVDRKFA